MTTALYRPGTRWQELLEVSPDLQALGIRVDQPLREAQSRVPHARYLPLDDATQTAIEADFTAVLDALEAFSPVVEPAPRDELGAGRALAYVDVAGLGPLYGTEPEIARRLAEAAGAAGGGEACVGIAGGKFTAWVAASLGTDEVTVVPPGEEALFLAPLPLDTLPLKLRTRQALHRVGVRTLGAYAALPANAVRHRYGIEGLAAHSLAHGRDDRPLRVRSTAPVAGVQVTFEWEESDLDRIGFAIKGLADQLSARLRRLEHGAESDGDESEDDPWRDESPPEDAPGDASHEWPEEYSQVPPDDDLGDPGSLGAAAPPREVGWAARRAAEKWGAQPVVAERRASWRKPPEPAPLFVVQALRVLWRLNSGEEREALLRLAEPAGTAAAFTEHLRWHLEGLDRLLLADDAPDEEEASESGPGFTYERIDHRAGVTAIALEAIGIGLPTGTQLKLLAPVARTADESGTLARLDAATRAHHARRGIARVQARWGIPAARGAGSSSERVPEARLRLVDPEIGLQLEGPEGMLGASRTTQQEAPADSAAPLSGEFPMWLVEPAEPVAILTPRKGGRKVLVRRTPTRCPGQPPLRGPQEARVVHTGGPWKVSDTRALATRDPLHRDYYQVELDDGAAYLIFWDRVADKWFLQGVFI